ncbi:MAG: ABC transporter substrate-binding protein [Rhizobiaceae bacterium]|nr:ABC transporter substrate-binding protein [Rhizobiaceae bacterium]
MIEINSGFIPLTDAAILIIAKEMGFAEEQGIALNLLRETSWANIRDRLAVGQFEVAHCLAPMPIASNLGLTPFATPLIAPMALGMGGNAITVSDAIYEKMCRVGYSGQFDASIAGHFFQKVVSNLRQNENQILKLGVVHPFSAHNFELRYWLSSVGVSPDEDVQIKIIPPMLMADALNAGQIDGFCVGEPWNSLAVSKSFGKVITTKTAIWASSPEKVLAVQSDWAEKNQDALQSLLVALVKAAKWCSVKENFEKLAKIISADTYLNIPETLVLGALSGSLSSSASINADHTLPFLEFYDNAATFPWQSHALWLYSQMVRWGHLEHSAESAEIAKSSFRPDIYRSALKSTDAIIPSGNSKVEGALKTRTAVGAASNTLYLGPDGFFDDNIFDPDKIDRYILGQSNL